MLDDCIRIISINIAGGTSTVNFTISIAGGFFYSTFCKLQERKRKGGCRLGPHSETNVSETFYACDIVLFLVFIYTRADFWQIL